MTAVDTPAYTYRPGDGNRYVWNRGPWITAETDQGKLVDYIQAPDTYTATAMMAAVDRWRADG